MFNGIPFNNYQIRQVKIIIIAVVSLIFTVILTGNIITAVTIKKTEVAPNSYIIKKGVPIFTSEKDYISFIRNYPHDPGIQLTIHSMRKGESFWNLTRKYNISIETLIGANPHITSLTAQEGTEVVIPAEDGLLLVFDDVWDVWNTAKAAKYTGAINGDYRLSIFKLISMDDIRLVFFKDVKPLVVNDSLEKLYQYKKIFCDPVRGRYTSLFGDRADPFIHDTAFHKGIDIHAKIGVPVKAARQGMVTHSGWKHGYGKSVVLQHYDGYSTVYGHFHTIKAEKGQWVNKGDVIGTVGSTGRSTGPHLHFEIRKHDKAINPLFYIW